MLRFKVGAYGVIAFGLAFVWLGLLSISLRPVQALDGYSIYYVASSCAGVPMPCFTAVQSAVDAADEPTDIIKVAASTYTDVHARPKNDIDSTGVVTQVVYISKTITLRGGYTTSNWITPNPIANPTTLNAQGKGRVIYITGNISPAIEGLRLTGGNSTDLGGGGVYVISASVTLNNNWIVNNTGFAGGAVFADHAASKITGNEIFSNIAEQCGGLRLSCQYPCPAVPNAIVTNNRIVSNTAGLGYGGGLCVDSSVAVIAENTISGNVAATYGGGLYLEYVADTKLSRNTISGNKGLYGGGGLYLGPCNDAALDANTITANSGGGLLLYNCSATFTNTIIADNVGDGVVLWPAARADMLHTTIARNHGDGVSVDWRASAYLTNTILVSNVVGIRDALPPQCSHTAEATLWYSNTNDWVVCGGTHNYWGDPLLANPEAGDYHIGAGSAAIDRGVNAGVLLDIDNEPRFDTPDLGADEYWPIGALKRFYLALLAH